MAGIGSFFAPRLSSNYALFELFAIAAAEAEPGSVVEEEFMAAVFVEFEAANAIEIDDGGAMDAAEDGRVEVLLEFGDASA